MTGQKKKKKKTMGIDHETVRVVGNIIGRNRVQLGLSMRDCEEIGKLVKAVTGASMGLAYKTLQQREKPFKDKAEAQVGDVQKSLSLLLKYFPLRLGGDFPTIIITWDGYSPYSAFRSQLARKRLAVAATNGLEATNFLTVADKKKIHLPRLVGFYLSATALKRSRAHPQEGRLRIFPPLLQNRGRSCRVGKSLQRCRPRGT